MPEVQPTIGTRVSRFFAARLWARILLFAVVGLPPLLGVTIGPLALMYRANADLKASDAYRRSLELVRESPRMRAALGEPMEPSYWATGMMMEAKDDRYTVVRYAVTGPKGAATVEVEADYADNRFTLRKVKAETDPAEPFVQLWPPVEQNASPEQPAESTGDKPDDAEASASDQAK